METSECPYCEKKFEGFSEKQVENFKRQHILSKHPEKVKFNGDKKNDTQ